MFLNSRSNLILEKGGEAHYTKQACHPSPPGDLGVYMYASRGEHSETCVASAARLFFSPQPLPPFQAPLRDLVLSKGGMYVLPWKAYLP